VSTPLPAGVLQFLESHREITLFCRDSQALPIGYPMMIFAQSPTTIFFSTYRKSKKVQHIERDPRVALLSYERDPQAPMRWVALNGTASLWVPTPAEVDELFASKGGDSRVPDTMTALVRQRTLEGKRVLLRIELDNPQEATVQEASQ
jgi:hypothetical protein